MNTNLTKLNEAYNMIIQDNYVPSYYPLRPSLSHMCLLITQCFWETSRVFPGPRGLDLLLKTPVPQEPLLRFFYESSEL